METAVPAGGGSRQRTSTPCSLSADVVVWTAMLPVAKRMGKTMAAGSMSFPVYRTASGHKGARVVRDPPGWENSSGPAQCTARACRPCAGQCAKARFPPPVGDTGGPAHAALRRTSRRLRAHGRVRRVRHAGAVRGRARGARGGARERRHVRRLAHGRDRGRRPARAADRPAAGHERSLEVQRATGPVQRTLQREERGNRRHHRLPVLSRAAVHLRQRERAREGFGVDARARGRRRRRRAAVRRLGADRHPRAERARARRLSLRAARAGRALLPFPGSDGRRRPGLHRRPHRLHGRGRVRGIRPSPGSAKAVGRAARQAGGSLRSRRSGFAPARSRVPAVRQRHGRAAHASRGGPRVDRQARQAGRIRRLGRAHPAEAGRPQTPAGRIQADRKGDRAPRLHGAEGRTARRRGDQWDHEPGAQGIDRPRLRSRRAREGGIHLRRRDPGQARPGASREDPLRGEDQVVTRVLLNHFYVTPDRETFTAAEGSGPLRRFGAPEKRTTVRKDATYTGLYLYGERTYLELLQPDSASFGAPSGVAYGVEERGGLESLRGALPSPKLEEIARGDVPWFRSLRSGQPLEGLAEWVMEYVPAFFRGFHPELPPAHPAIARSDALTRYAASCGMLKDRAEGLFEDVVALEIALAPADWQRWRSRPLRVEEADLRVTSAPPGTPTGVLAAHLRLRRDAGRSTERIGSTTLSLDGKDAVWRFQRGLHGELS